MYHYKLVAAKEPRVVADLNPRGMFGRIYAQDYLTLIYIFGV